MKAQRRLGRALSWPWITSAFLTNVAVPMLAVHLPIPAPPTVAWWVGVGVVAVLTIAFKPSTPPTPHTNTELCQESWVQGIGLRKGGRSC